MEAVQVDTSNELAGLLDSLYETALSPERLGQALADCAAWVGGGTYHLLSHDARTGAPLMSVASPESAPAEASYLAYYGDIDPRRMSLEAKAVGELAACQLDFSPAFVSRSEIWQDLLVPSGARYTSGGVLQRDGDIHTLIGFHRPASRGSFADEDLRRTALLLPHLARAVRLIRHAAGARQELHAAREGLNAHADGVFLISGTGRLRWANAAGEALLTDGQALRLSGGRVAAGDHSLIRLRDVFKAVLAGAPPQARRLTAGASSVSAFDSLYVTVMRAKAMANPATAPAIGSTPSLLMVAHSPTARPMSARALAQAFGLTPAESALAADLAGGTSVELYAAHNGLKLPTVRTHLRALYAKTGVRKLQDLLRLLGGLKSPGSLPR